MTVTLAIHDEHGNLAAIAVDDLTALGVLRNALDAAFRAALDDDREQIDMRTYPPPTKDELDALRQEFAVEVPF